MKMIYGNPAILRALTVTLSIGIIAGCSSAPLKATSIVQNNIEQDRLTPDQSINKALVLDAYQHHLGVPVDAPLAVHAISQFDYFLREGGTGIVQVALSTLAAGYALLRSAELRNSHG